MIRLRTLLFWGHEVSILRNIPRKTWWRSPQRTSRKYNYFIIALLSCCFRPPFQLFNVNKCFWSAWFSIKWTVTLIGYKENIRCLYLLAKKVSSDLSTPGRKRCTGRQTCLIQQLWISGSPHDKYFSPLFSVLYKFSHKPILDKCLFILWWISKKYI